MSLEIKNVSKFYGKTQVLFDLNFSIQENNIVGFLGPNGAGKSTMMKIITGSLSPDSGEVFIEGIDTKKNPISAKKIIGYLPEHNPLYTEMYVKEFLEFSAGFYNINNKNQRINSLIEQIGLGEMQHKKIAQLSKGFRQRVGLAQALLHDPKVLILDEPLTGLDPNQLLEIRTLIKSLATEKIVLFSTHIMQEVQALCNRTIVINKGKIAADFSLENLEIPLEEIFHNLTKN